MVGKTSAVLTPAQFQAARALASAFGHLWASVPDGTLAIADIEAYSDSIQNASLPGGIYAPYLNENNVVLHVTGSGRLQWEIEPSGNVTLSIFRPADLSSTRANMARTMAYAAVSSVQPPADAGIEVARVQVLNYDAERFEVSLDNILVHTSSMDEWQADETHRSYNTDLRDDIMFHRHVIALAEPLGALLTAHHFPIDYAEEEQGWEKAKELLAVLFAKALPDYIDANDEGDRTTTYWTMEHTWEDSIPTVAHKGETFPVETERAAVHAVLLLQRSPDLALLEAVKAAIKARGYRPE